MSPDTHPGVVQEPLKRRPLLGPAFDGVGGAGGGSFIPHSGRGLGGSMQTAERPDSEPDPGSTPSVLTSCVIWSK